MRRSAGRGNQCENGLKHTDETFKKTVSHVEELRT
jgi:hypothetical protein